MVMATKDYIRGERLTEEERLDITILKALDNLKGVRK